MKRKNIYQASKYNVTFDPTKTEAWSYKWWKFVSVQNGLVVFNTYRYSVSTSKHQSKVRTLLSALGIKIDLAVECSEGLQDSEAGHQALKHAYRTQNLAVVPLIEKAFNIKFNDEQIQEIYVELEEELCDDYLLRSVLRQEKIERKGLLNIALETHVEKQAS
jgi:hypothetical protein